MALFLFSSFSAFSLAAAASRACCVTVGTSRHDNRAPELRTNVPESTLALSLGPSPAVCVCVCVCVQMGCLECNDMMCGSTEQMAPVNSSWEYLKWFSYSEGYHTFLNASHTGILATSDYSCHIPVLACFLGLSTTGARVSWSGLPSSCTLTSTS